jgi:hypothetical protein
MNKRILLLAMVVAAFSSCSVYKSGQTPDDVYYSPGPAAREARQQRNDNSDDEYLAVNQQKQGTNMNTQSYDQYQDGVRDDRFLRMSVDNPYYMNAYNSYSAFDWRYNSYYDGFNYGFGSPWNNYFAWNSFYNPYYSGLGLGFGYGGLYGGYYGNSYGGAYYGKAVAATPISRPLSFNVASYTNSNRPVSRNYLNGSYNNSNRYNNNNSNGGRTNNTYYNNNNNGGRSTYTPSNSNNNSYTPAPSRSYTPSSSGTSGGGGGGGGISRPGRN